MTSDPDPLENALRQLRLAPTSAELASRLAHALQPAASIPPPRSRARATLQRASPWLAWSIAAAMTVAFFARTPPPPDARPAVAGRAMAGAPSAADAGGFQPVSSSNVLVAAQDEGLVLLDNGQPARKVRYEYLDTIKLLSTDSSRATVDVSFPREEIRLVPVQTF